MYRWRKSRRAAQCSARQRRADPRAHSSGNSASLTTVRRRNGCGSMVGSSCPVRRPCASPTELTICRYMTRGTGTSPYSVKSRCANIEVPQVFGNRRRLLARARMKMSDEFLAMKGASGWKRRNRSRWRRKHCVPSFATPRPADGARPGFAKGIEGPKNLPIQGFAPGPELGRSAETPGGQTRFRGQLSCGHARSSRCSRSMDCAVAKCHG